MSRLIDYLIEDVREHTENEEFSDTEGIGDKEFLRFLNDAHHRIHSLIVQQHPAVFVAEESQDIVRSQESYTLPQDIHLANKVTQVDYSDTSLDQDYYPLDHASLRNRASGILGIPSFYTRKSGTILLAPVPDASRGSIRISYIRSILKLDKRRASVASSTLDSSDNSITALTLNVSTDNIDSTALGKNNYLSIVDRNGNVKMRNIEFDSIDTTTGIVTITSGFAYTTGESITAGDYVVSGRNVTTHSELPDAVERYLIAYCAWKILKRDSSADYAEQQQELLEMEREIVAGYADIIDDLSKIPDLNSNSNRGIGWW